MDTHVGEVGYRSPLIYADMIKFRWTLHCIQGKSYSVERLRQPPPDDGGERVTEDAHPAADVTPPPTVVAAEHAGQSVGGAANAEDADAAGCAATSTPLATLSTGTSTDEEGEDGGSGSGRSDNDWFLVTRAIKNQKGVVQEAATEIRLLASSPQPDRKDSCCLVRQRCVCFVLFCVLFCIVLFCFETLKVGMRMIGCTPSLFSLARALVCTLLLSNAC